MHRRHLHSPRVLKSQVTLAHTKHTGLYIDAGCREKNLLHHADVVRPTPPVPEVILGSDPEGPRPVAGAAAVDENADETELGDGLGVVEQRLLEALRHVRGVRPGVDILHYPVALGAVEIGRPPHQRVQCRHLAHPDTVNLMASLSPSV